MKLLIFFALPFLVSFKFSPMSAVIQLKGNERATQFVIENENAEPMAVEFSVRGRVPDESGNEENPEVSELTIFPPQLIVPPREKRTVRVSWKGSKDLKSEKAFRVIAEQLPLNVDQQETKGSGIRMLMKYVAALYVAPANAKPEVKVSYQLESKELALKVENQGTSHVILKNPQLRFKKGERTWSLGPDELRPLVGENVLANHTRVFRVPVPKELPSDAQANLKLFDE